MGVFVSTVSATVNLPKLGLVLAHPTTNYDLSAQFSGDDLKRADDLTTAITGGTLTWKRTAGGAVEAAGDYDPDFLDVDNENAGGQVLYRAPKFSDLHYHRATTNATTLNGTLTLTKTSEVVQFLTGTQTGYSVVLPDATTETIGRWFEIFNMSSQPVTLKTSGGASLGVIGQTSIAYVRLQTQPDAAGTWVFWQVFVSSLASGILNYNVVGSTAFTTSSTTDVAITGLNLTPAAGVYATWFNADASATQNNANVNFSIYRGGTQIADTARRVQSVSSNFIYQMSTMTVATFDGSQVADVRVRTSQGSITVNGRSLLMIRLGS